eukprot:2920247-Amphidinium_carterae.1
MAGNSSDNNNDNYINNHKQKTNINNNNDEKKNNNTRFCFVESLIDVLATSRYSSNGSRLGTTLQIIVDCLQSIGTLERLGCKGFVAVARCSCAFCPFGTDVEKVLGIWVD